MHYWLIMPAAGSGSRFGERLPKQYVEILGRAIIEWSLAPFLDDPRCAGIVVALAAGDPHWPRLARRVLERIETVQGGAERSMSVRRGLAALARRAAAEDWVLVHDAARPCLAAADRDRLLARCADHPVGGLLAVPVADTLKYAGGGEGFERTVDRAGLWRALTPQMFRYGALCSALDDAFAAGRSPTDESQALEWTGAQPLRVEGSPSNLKITTAEDLALAIALVGGRGRRESMRVGTGFDVHAFGPGEFVMLGGLKIAHTHGVVAHSDGDVVLHALCDALLGAAGLGDIGQHFRDDDPKWRGAASSGFVRAVLAMLKERGLAVANADVTVIAEAPRLSACREAMRESLARLLEVDVGRVNIKATTTERLGFLGRREGLAAEAVVLLEEAHREREESKT
jgi:2-C-methyl-D-erythritol 4-phosphate cytidylyltransferase / 2-C-methyl-D-erythritol 2,4-cyclodiphosphate synthase